MINILFIAFEFPPLNRGGVYRSLSFVRHLRAFGINPIVLTLHRDSFTELYGEHHFDDSLGQDVVNDKSIVGIPLCRQKKLSRLQQFTSIYFSIHGVEVEDWKRNFYLKIEKIIDKYDPKVVFATVPPFGVLPLAEQVSKKYSLPLVLDFRDAWSQWKIIPYGTILHYHATCCKERRYLEQAEAVVATSRQTLSDFKHLYKKINPKKFHYIPNGFEGELPGWKSIDVSKKTITIGYVGSFYYDPAARQQMLMPWWRKKGHRMLQYIPHKQDWLYRSPYFFFKALSALNQKWSDLGKRIKVRFIGAVADWMPEMIKEFNLENQVEILGEMSHEDSLSFQESCDTLLITSAKQLGGKDYSIAGKTFEYLKMQRPILSFACDGAQREFLIESGCALICDPDNTCESMGEMYDLFSGEIELQPDYEKINLLKRKNLTSQLADIIKKSIQG